MYTNTKINRVMLDTMTRGIFNIVKKQGKQTRLLGEKSVIDFGIWVKIGNKNNYR